MGMREPMLQAANATDKNLPPGENEGLNAFEITAMVIFICGCVGAIVLFIYLGRQYLKDRAIR